MRKNYCFAIVFCFCSVLLFAQSAPNFSWVNSIGGSSLVEGTELTVDNSGNPIIVGSFYQTIDLDPGSATSNATANGSSDIFVSKLTSSGQMLWGVAFGGVQTENVRSVEVDDAGNVYVLGIFQETVDFDPGIGVENLTSNGEYDMFILKLNSQGDFVWAKQLGGNLNDTGETLKIYNNEIFIVGAYRGEVDFDVSSGVETQTSNGNADVYILKLDLNGDYIWSKQFGGSENDDGISIDFDSNDNLLITGVFRDAVDFDTGTGSTILTSFGQSDCYVLKLNNLGEFVWVKQLGGTSIETSHSVAVDALDNVYLLGSFSGTCDVDPGASVEVLTSNGAYDMFFVNLNSSGDYVWGKQIGGSGSDFGTIVTIKSGNIYLSGVFTATVDFNVGAGVYDLTSNGNVDFFILMLDSNGDFVWAQNYGGTSADTSGDIEVVGTDQIYAIGSYQSTVDFDLGPGDASLTSEGLFDAFVFKLTDCIPDSTNISETACNSYNWYGNDYSTTGTYSHNLLNQTGCDSVITLNLTINETGDLSTTTNEATISATNTNADSYQWIDCSDNSEIAGETNSSYTATASGEYAVIITNNNCSDTSDCVAITIANIESSIEEGSELLDVYPNPNSGTFTISSSEIGSQVQIVTLDGKVLRTFVMNANKKEITLDIEAGVYLLKFSNGNKRHLKRVVVK